MLPVTGTWALPFTAYLFVLTGRIVNARIKNDRSLGDSISSTGPNHDNPDELYIATRAHANFLENVPLAFLLAGIAELNGANRKVMNWAFGALFVLRILHVELGLKQKGGVGLGRPLAFFGSSGFLGGFAAYGAYLVKGYWGY
ncbi:MAG: hypothetical protein M1819_003852 [Sarea resinae]|nr:MAG: hypothetical protein M1819_003852 [Sarea resinae]